MAAKASRQRSGFALFVVIVMFAVAAIIATVVLGTLSGDNDQDRVERAADVLHRLVAEIDTSHGGGQAFAGQVSVWPSKLSQLYTPITSSDLQCSGQTYKTQQVTSWRGPYHLVPIGTSGYNIAPGFFANDALTTLSKTDLAITIPNVSLADAQALDLFVDKALSSTTGVVTYSGTTTQTVLYHITPVTC